MNGLKKLLVALLVLAACRGREVPKRDPKIAAERTAALAGKLVVTDLHDVTMLVVVDLDPGTTVIVTRDGEGQELLRQAERLKHRMTPVTAFPYPKDGNVRFYVRTPQRVYSIEEPAAELADRRHPLASLYAAALAVAKPPQK